MSIESILKCIIYLKDASDIKRLVTMLPVSTMLKQ